MAEETIFSKIIRKEIPADIVYQDDLVTAFRDINPQAPIHILIIPSKVIPTVDDIEENDEATLGHMFIVAKKVAAQEGLDKGYRLIINCKEHANQEVFHLHMHLLGGHHLGKMVQPPLENQTPTQFC